MNPSPNELLALAREVLAAKPGVSAKQIRRILPVPLRRLESKVLEVLRTMAARGEAWRVTTSRTELFFPADPVETLDRIIPHLLTAPLGSRELRGLVERHAPGHGAIADDWARSALTRGLLVERHATPAAPARSDEDVVVEALHEVASKRVRGTLLLVHKVRDAAGLPKDRFDRAVLSLSRQRRAVIHHHDHPKALQPADRERLVHDADHGVYYIGIAPRGPEDA